jgi:hypothetical protein
MTRREQVRSTVLVIRGEPVPDPARGDRVSPLPDHHRASSTTSTTSTTSATSTTVTRAATVAFVVAGSYRIDWLAGDSAAKQSLILHAGEGVILREVSDIGLVLAPPLPSDSAIGSKPWLTLITLESSSDSSAAIAL